MRRQIQAFILRALRQHERPMTDESLRAAIRLVYQHVAFTEGDLSGHIRSVEENELIAGTEDRVLGKVWLLTPAGKIATQQLG